MNRTPQVYAIRDPRTGRIKIGTTCDVKQRMSECRTWLTDAQLVGHAAGDRARESLIHTQLDAHRLPGTEWFEPHPQVLDLVTSLCAEGEAERQAAAAREAYEASLLPIARYLLTARRSAGLSQRQLAAKLSVTAMTVCRWERGEAVPKLAYWGPLSEALGVSHLAIYEQVRDSQAVAA